MWKRFSTYAGWKRSYFEQYRERGWFHTKTGFTISGDHKRNEVVNYPIQGSAFHCLLWAMTELIGWLRKRKMRSKVIGQIHDSMVIDLHRDEVQDVLAKTVELSTVGVSKAWRWINIPLAVELEGSEMGGNWWDKKEWVNTGGKWGPKDG